MAVPASLLDEYLDARVRQLGALGGAIQEVDVNEFGDSAAIHAFVAFGDRGLLTVLEYVHLEEDGPRTRRSAYQGAWDGDFLFRYDYDPIAHPEMPAHKHAAAGEAPVPWQRVTLEAAAAELQAQIGARCESRN